MSGSAAAIVDPKRNRKPHATPLKLTGTCSPCQAVLEVFGRSRLKFQRVSVVEAAEPEVSDVDGRRRSRCKIRKQPAIGAVS